MYIYRKDTREISCKNHFTSTLYKRVLYITYTDCCESHVGLFNSPRMNNVPYAVWSLVRGTHTYYVSLS